jgi:hypothetical protein
VALSLPPFPGLPEQFVESRSGRIPRPYPDESGREATAVKLTMANREIKRKLCAGCTKTKAVVGVSGLCMACCVALTVGPVTSSSEPVSASRVSAALSRIITPPVLTGTFVPGKDHADPPHVEMDLELVNIPTASRAAYPSHVSPFVPPSVVRGRRPLRMTGWSQSSYGAPVVVGDET